MAVNMKVDTKIVQVTEYTFSSEEARKLKMCLDYCHHRIVKHGKFAMGDLKFIDDTRNALTP